MGTIEPYTFVMMLSTMACHYLLFGVFFSGISQVCSIQITAQQYLLHLVSTRYIIHFSVWS